MYYLAAPARLALYPFALLYGGVVWLRNRLYNTGFLTAVQFLVPVISVGNLSTGGTGKTPHIEYLIRLLSPRYEMATLSRGYKRRTQGFLLAGEGTNALRIGDEPMQYHLKFPRVTVAVAEDRMTGIPRLILERPEVEVVLLDDAFQHRSVKPGLSILITDWSRPFWKDRVLPLGGLREGRGACVRADVIVVSKCPPTVTAEERSAAILAIRPLPHQTVCFSHIRYGRPIDFFSGEELHLDSKPLVLVAGIAHPEPLLAMLESAGQRVHLLRYADHHFFGSRDVEEMLAARAVLGDDAIIVTTEKDASRLHLHREKLAASGATIAVQPIEVAFFDETFDAQIRTYMDAAAAKDAGSE